MKEYTPGQGSYKVEEAGALTGVGTSHNVDNNFGTLVLPHTAFSIAARGLPLSLSGKFDSDQAYSVVIPRVSKGDEPDEIPETLMTLPENQANFYRICNGWSWALPYVRAGEDDEFKFAPGNGQIFDLKSILTEECFGEGTGQERWTEGYHVVYGIEDTNVSPVTIVIPEIQMTIVCEVYRNSATEPDTFKVNSIAAADFKIYRADGSVMTFNSAGYLDKIEDMAGKNSVQYYYDTYTNGVETGTVRTLTSSGRKIFDLDSGDGAKVQAGDLLTIGDETRVIFSVTGDTVTLASKLDIAPTANTSTYTIHKGQLEKIVHSDGRCVKFYYSADGQYIVTLLSSSTTYDYFAAGDLFLNRYTINTTTNRLEKIEVLTTVRTILDDTFEADMWTTPSNYFTPLQHVAYDYQLSNDPTPETDFITVTNHLGAITKYYFQKGAFCSHTYNNAFFHQGSVRRGGTLKSMCIERPDFYIQSGSLVNICRIDDRAFADVSKDDYQKDENQKEFKEDVIAASINYWTNVAMFAVNMIGIDVGDALMGVIGQGLAAYNYARTLNRWGAHAQIAANAQPVTSFATITTVAKSDLLKFSSALADYPRQNDIYAIIDPGVIDYTCATSRSSRNATRTYADYRAGVATDFEVGDYVFMRHEMRKITKCSNELFGGTTHYFIEVDYPWSFIPLEKEDVAFAYANEEEPEEYWAYYLNKPKVVKIETKQSAVATEWTAAYYEHSYRGQDTVQIDDYNQGGFTGSNIEGPADHTIPVNDIAPVSTSIINVKETAEGAEELTKTIHSFSYDTKGLLKGENAVVNYVRENEDWVAVDKKDIMMGRPCRNAGYYGETGHYYYAGNDGNGGPARMYTYRLDHRFDTYGRPIQSRKTSSYFNGNRTQMSWTQYVGSSDEDDLDPMNKFSDNPYSDTYQDLLDSKHALGLVGATKIEVNAARDTNDSFNEFDTTGNLIETLVVEKSNLYDDDGLFVNKMNMKFETTGVSKNFAEHGYDDIGWLEEGETGDPNYGESNWDKRNAAWYNVVSESRNSVTQFTYETGEELFNRLTKITKPEGNEINLTYGASGWEGSYVVEDVIELDDNLDSESQFIVNEYEYDIKGRLLNKTTKMIDDEEAEYDSDKYPQSMVEYEYDGMNRVTKKSIGNTVTNEVQFNQYNLDDKTATVTDYLGFRTRTTFDELFRPIMVQSYKPSEDVAGDPEWEDIEDADEVLIGQVETTYDLATGKPYEVVKYTAAVDGEADTTKKIITRNTYDNQGRLLKSEFRNTDSAFGGSSDAPFVTTSEVEYDDKRNHVITKAYLQDGVEGSDYVQTKIENDWLGRGPLKTHSWTGKNATGSIRTVQHFYSPTGKTLRTILPSKEVVRYIYDNLGRINKTVFPDTTFETVYYDQNGNVTETIDRNSIMVNFEYNNADLMVRKVLYDELGDYGDIVQETKHCHFGPAQIEETEDGTTILKTRNEYNFFGGVLKHYQDVAGSPTRRIESGYDAGGNQNSIRAYGDGGAFDKTLGVSPIKYDSNNYNSIVVDESSAPKITLENNFAGILDTIKYGNSVRTVAHTYDELFRIERILSNDSALDVNLTRDVVGNIATRKEPANGSQIDFSYTYDGMGRLLTGEGETCSYDVLSNILARGNKTFAYQAPSVENNQMRLSSFNNDGTVKIPTYDSKGQITAITNNASRYSALKYDHLGRLRELTRTAGTDKFWYNAAGLRFKKEEGTDTTYTMFSGNQILFQEKYNSTPTLTESRLNLVVGGMILGHIKKSQPAGSYVYEFFGIDHQGSRKVVWNDSGTSQETFDYTAWGEWTRSGGDDDYLASFTGKEYDTSGLLYFNARYYDPEIGRFLTEDPARKGTSWYSYCGNNPVNAVDPDGRDPYKEMQYYNDPVEVKLRQWDKQQMGQIYKYRQMQKSYENLVALEESGSLRQSYLLGRAGRMSYKAYKTNKLRQDQIMLSCAARGVVIRGRRNVGEGISYESIMEYAHWMYDNNLTFVGCFGSRNDTYSARDDHLFNDHSDIDTLVYGSGMNMIKAVNDPRLGQYLSHLDHGPLLAGFQINAIQSPIPVFFLTNPGFYEIQGDRIFLMNNDVTERFAVEPYEARFWEKARDGWKSGLSHVNPATLIKLWREPGL